MIGKTNVSGKPFSNILNDNNITELKSSMAKIPSYYFEGCTSLISATFSKNYTSGQFGAYIFRDCTNLTTISFPNLTTISSKGTFYGCSSLINIDLPSISSLTEETFRDCTSLTSISFPNIYSTARDIFRGCTSLTSVDLLSVITIENGSFRDCTSLTSIVFPSVTQIKVNAFLGCTNLTSITLKSSTTCQLDHIGAIPASSSQHITIYVPSNKISSYQTATNWSTLYNNGYIDFVAISS